MTALFLFRQSVFYFFCCHEALFVFLIEAENTLKNRYIEKQLLL